MTSKIKVDQIENSNGSGDVAFTGTNGIKLDTIKSSNGTLGLSVASTGIVTASKEVINTDYTISQWRLTANTNNSTNGVIASNWEAVDTDGWQHTSTGAALIGSAMQHSSGLFTFPKTGVYQITFFCTIDVAANDTDLQIYMQITPDNGSNYSNVARGDGGSCANIQQQIFLQGLVNITNTTQDKVRFETAGFASGTYIYGNSDMTYSGVIFERKGPAQS